MPPLGSADRAGKGIRVAALAETGLEPLGCVCNADRVNVGVCMAGAGLVPLMGVRGADRARMEIPEAGVVGRVSALRGPAVDGAVDDADVGGWLLERAAAIVAAGARGGVAAVAGGAGDTVVARAAGLADCHTRDAGGGVVHAWGQLQRDQHVFCRCCLR
jgi:hypothetical protein